MLGNPSVMSGLRAQPITVGQAKETTEPQIGVGRDRTLSSDDVSNALRRNPDFLGQTVLTNAHGLKELLQQELAKGHKLELAHIYVFSSVVIHYLYIFSIRSRPAKADAPLIIDANGSV